MATLTAQSFKFPVHCYWVTSREADDCCWSAVLGPQQEAVKEYEARVSRGDAMPTGLEHLAHLNDINDHWLGLFSRKAHHSSARGTKGVGGVAVPMFLSEELVEAWTHVRGMQQRAQQHSAHSAAHSAALSTRASSRLPGPRRCALPTLHALHDRGYDSEGHATSC